MRAGRGQAGLFMEMRLMHEFRKSLAISHAAADLPIWEECYRQFFGSRLVHIQDLRHDGFHQRSGVDRALMMRNGITILVDEKYRPKMYKDIFLEFWSDQQRRIEGWVVKDSLCHYLAYAVGPLGVCYLFPMLQLQYLWEKNNDRWRKQYGEKRVRNQDWITVGTPVPVEDIFGAMLGVMRATFSPIQTELLVYGN
jgi:hypothetical protein